MKLTVQLALFGWPFVSLALFFVMRPRRAVLASLILGWLFLPMASLKLMSGLPEYSKITASCLGAMLGVVVFDLDRLLAFRPSWKDLPMAVFCLCPFASSMSNQLGVGDGLSGVFYKAQTWGIPYFLARLYCSNLLGMRDLALAIFLGGLLYVPFCLYEIRMSPQLHRIVYGYHPHSFGQTIRFGGWRPVVFMQHGLMLSMWMAMACLSGIWLWASGAVRSIGRIPLPWFLAVLLVTTLMCKSLGSLVLLAIGLAMLLASRSVPTKLALVALALAAPLYFVLRIPNLWSGSNLAEVAETISQDRSQSLQFRLDNENRLVERAMQRPVFGWGGWGRARVRDQMGRDISVTDGLWIIVLGNEGLVGLLAMLGIFLIPAWTLYEMFPVGAWKHPAVAPALAICVVALLYLVDSIFNDMKHPAYTMALGGLTCLTIGPLRRRARRPARAVTAPGAPQPQP